MSVVVRVMPAVSVASLALILLFSLLFWGCGQWSFLLGMRLPRCGFPDAAGGSCPGWRSKCRAC